MLVMMHGLSCNECVVFVCDVVWCGVCAIPSPVGGYCSCKLLVLVLGVLVPVRLVQLKVL